MRPLLFLFALTFTVEFLLAQEWPGKDWPKATPSSQQVNADSLDAMEGDIRSGKFGNIDAMIVIRHGKMVFEKYFSNDYARIYKDSVLVKSALNSHDPGGQYNYYNSWWHPYYRRGKLHSLQSVTKTITSVVIGAAITRKDFPSINTPVMNFFDSTQVKNIDDRKRRMTILHLLTMTAGFDWNELVHYSDPRNDCTNMEASFDWVQYVIDKPMAEEPGSRFNYNSGASQLLAYIFRKATGMDMEEYAVLHLFEPLGIEQHYWKRIPTGLPDTEGGLYLKETDLARIFYLFLKNGKWKDRLIIDPQWVKASISPFTRVGGTAQYGYKWWLFSYGKDNGKSVWAGSGFGGQWPMVIPELDMVVVFTGWNVIGGSPSLRVQETIRRLVGAVSIKN